MLLLHYHYINTLTIIKTTFRLKAQFDFFLYWCFIPQWWRHAESGQPHECQTNRYRQLGRLQWERWRWGQEVSHSYKWAISHKHLSCLILAMIFFSPHHTFLPSSSIVPVASSALSFPSSSLLLWLLQLFLTLLLAQIALPLLPPTSETPLDPFFQPQVAPSLPFLLLISLLYCLFFLSKRRRCETAVIGRLSLYNSISHSHAICSAYHIFLIWTLNTSENHVITY